MVFIITTFQPLYRTCDLVVKHWLSRLSYLAIVSSILELVQKNKFYGLVGKKQTISQGSIKKARIIEYTLAYTAE